MDDFPEFRVGEFIIEAKLGEGGMGAVYKAKQTGLDRYVAIKVLPPQASANPEFVARFEREAKAAAAIVHPNIIQIYTIGRSMERPYFAMEFVEGRDLEQLISSGEFAPTLRESVEIVKACCNALAVATDRNITHRDIKPANIMIDLNGTCKVMDFGLARIADAGQNKLTMEGTVMGTPNYMPPEQGLGEAVDPRADQYSLGCVLFEMLAGEPVFTAQSMAQILYKHIYEKPRDLQVLRPDLPAGLADICHKMLQKRKEDRFAQPTDIIQALDKLQFAPALPTPDLRGKVRAARTKHGSSAAPKDRRQLSMELSQDKTLMSLVAPLERQEPNARTQGGAFAQTLLTRGPSGALSIPNAPSGALSMPNAPSGALSMAGGLDRVDTQQSTRREHNEDAQTLQESMSVQTTKIRADGQAGGGLPGASSALSLMDKGGEGSRAAIAAIGQEKAQAAAGKKSNLGLILGGVAVVLIVAGIGIAMSMGGDPAGPLPPPGGNGPAGNGLVLVPFSKLPQAGPGIAAKLKIDGLDNPIPTADRTQEPNRNYALVYSKKGYQDQVIALTLDPKTGVKPDFAAIRIELKPTAELEQSYADGVSKQEAGDFGAAQICFKQVVALDPDFKDARDRLAAVEKVAARQANASQAALDAAQAALDNREWAQALTALQPIPAADPLYAKSRELHKTATAKQQEFDLTLQQVGLDLTNGKFGEVDTKLVAAGALAPKNDPTLQAVSAKLKAAREAVDKGTQLYLDSRYEDAKKQFEIAREIAPNYDLIKEKLRKIDMALKPTGETGQLIQEVQEAVTANNFTKASERLKKIPEEFQDLPLVVDLNSTVLRGLNRKSIEDFLVSLDKAYTAGDERDMKRHLTVRPDGELAGLEKALADFDKELKFKTSEHALVRLAFLDRGGRQARVVTRWRYDVESLPYKATLKGELPREIMIQLEQGQWQITGVKTGDEATGAEEGGEPPAPAPAPATAEGLPELKRLVGQVTAVTPQTVTPGEDPAKLVTATGENTVTISLTREQIDHAMQGRVSGKPVFDIYTPDKVVRFPLSKTNAVVEGKYVGAVRVDVPGDEATVCVVQDGKIEDFKPGMTAVQSLSRSGLPKMPSPSGVAVSKSKVYSNSPVVMKITVINPENNLVHYRWSAEGGQFRFARTDIASNQWFPPVAAGKYKIRVDAESVYGQTTKMAEFTLESLGPDVDHRPTSLTPFAAGHQPGFGHVLSLCFDETNNGFVIAQKEQSYTFSIVTPGLVNYQDVSLMREEEAQNLKILVSADQVYVLNRKTNTVQSFPLKENLFATLPAATATYGGAGQGAGKYQTADDFVVTPLGEVAILDSTARTVSLFTPGGRYIMSFGSYGQAQGQLDKPTALAVDGRGHAFVLDAARQLVIHFDGGRMAREIKFDVGAAQKQQQLTKLAIDYGTGRLFVLDSGLNRVYAVDTATGRWLTQIEVGKDGGGLATLKDVNGIAVDRTGRLYVISAGGRVVQKYSGDGAFLGRLDSRPAAMDSYSDLAIAPDGTGFLLDRKNKIAVRLSNDGLMTHELGRGVLVAPVAIACDGQGRLLVLDPGLQGGSVAQFTALDKAPAVLLAGQFASGVDLSAAGDRALALLSAGGGTGKIIDLTKGTVTATVGLAGATQAAIDGGGQIHFAVGAQVKMLKADTTPGENWQVAFKSVGSLCASPSGMIYAVDVANKQLTGVDSRSGQAPLVAPAPDGCQTPAAVGVDAQGQIYLLDGTTGGVVRYLPNPGQ